MSDTLILDNITIVLKKPRFPENIGATARAMSNMGLSHLTVVMPENYELEKIYKMATHKAAHIVDNAVIVSNMEDALCDFTYVIGSSARMGKQRLEFDSPEELAEKLTAVTHNNKTAILFGPEDRGLTNEDIRYCHSLVHIPTAQFSSLNLSQAVIVIAYELFKKSFVPTEIFTPKLAKVIELEGMYNHLKDILEKIKFENPQNADYWLNRFRKFFTRVPIRAKEVKLVRGMLKQINRYGEKRYQDGLKDKNS
ncbi:MAG: RNA methyltransferase [Proteobacteria bacterium]|nr:RNA methyltransferase [Pseudomonadota bacterium]